MPRLLPWSTLLFLLIAAVVPAAAQVQATAEPRLHAAALGGFAVVMERSGSEFDPPPHGKTTAIQISAGWMVSPRIGIDLEFARGGEVVVQSIQFGRPSIQLSTRNRHEETLVTPLLRIRLWNRGKGMVDAVAGAGWMREQFHNERRAVGSIPPAPFSDTVTVRERGGNVLAVSWGADLTGWLTRTMGVTGSVRMRVANRDEDQINRPSALGLSSGLGVRLRF